MDRVKTKEDPWIGKTIAEKYLLEKLIGTGGMGSVYAGKHVQLGRAIAVKVMNADTVSDETAVARFIREAKTAAKLDHANAVTIHDFGSTSNGGAFIVMEYISGQSLRKYLSKHGALSLKQTLAWFMPICEVIEAAHQRGIIHRDLKPENIMLKEIGEEIVIKVVDFGLAKLVTNTDASQKLTKTGEFMGTPQYMAPEVYDGEAADHRTDIYALGIILYEMISGKIPFAGSVQNIISGHLFNEPKPITSINPNLPIEIDQVLALALEKNRDKRISSAVEFANAFKKSISKISTQQIIKQTVATQLKNIPLEDETNLPTVRDSIA
ncbi:MAG: serine/threonine protein kinase, partial [Blastocatellia bacterium]|nr:serine/threonine protein kinase [Blastocatellia bacterium]